MTLPMHDPERPLQAEAIVDLTAIRGNARALLDNTTAEMMAVVKADGYGHGLLPAARAVLAGGATWLGVCNLEEARALREAEITAPILAWLVAPRQDLTWALRNNIDLSVASERFLSEVIDAAQAANSTARIHLKVDTGLGRNGAPVSAWESLLRLAARAESAGEVEIVGIWSHFAYADAPGHPTIASQVEVFDDALVVAKRVGVEPQIRHLANSAASLTLPEAHYDMIRPGISLYGFSPMPGREKEFGLTPAMTLQAQVVLSKRTPAEHGVSYGHAYVTGKETTLALIPLGYADGITRSATNRGPVQLGGEVRRISGRVCMDQIVLDVGDDPVVEGDIATVFGSGESGEPTGNDWAEVLDTISYEIVTRVGSRVPRTYINSKLRGVMHT